MRLARDWEKASELDESKAPNTRRVVIRSGAVIGKDGGVVKNTKLPFLLGFGGPIGEFCSSSIRIFHPLADLSHI